MDWLRAPKGMPIWLWPVMLLAFCLNGAGSASAAPPQAAFTGLADLRKPLRGVVSVRVAGDEGTLTDSRFYAIRVDGRQCAVFDRLPYTFRWNTTPISDGSRVLSLYLLDVHTSSETRLDEIAVHVANHPEQSGSSASDKAVPPSAKADSGAPAKRADASVKTKSEAVTPSEAKTGSLPAVPFEREPREDLAVPVVPAAAEAKPLSVRASVLVLSGQKLLIGRDDGGLTIYNTVTHVGRTVHVEAGAGPVCGIATAGSTIYWLCGAGPTLHRYAEAIGEHRSFPIQGASALKDPVRCMVASREYVAYARSFETTVLDASTGNVASLDRFLGADVARAVEGTEVHLAADGADILLVSVRRGPEPAFARAWRSSGSGGWILLGECPVLSRQADRVSGNGQPAEVASPRVSSYRTVMALTPRAFVSVLGGTVEVRRMSADNGAATTASLPDIVKQPDMACSLSVSDSTLWWINCGVVYTYNLTSHVSDAFVPWNDARDAWTLVADGSAAWVATTAGVRHVVPAQSPDAKTGYGGFVRVPLREDGATPPPGAAARLAAEIVGWRGAPYVWGGSTKQGTDCSGFVMGAYRAIGISLPHGSAALPTASGGQTVRDELRYGDVLCYPGHAAIYTGNGTTAETVSGQGVSTGSIWFRRDVVVRRFLGIEAERTKLASRHSTTPRTRKRKHGVSR